MADESEIKKEAAAEGESVAEEKREHKRRRRGGRTEGEGSTKPQLYNGQGSNEMAEAKDETASFKRGGHMRRRDGGMAEGERAGGRLDRRPRRAAGGRTGGHTPYSSAASMTGPTDDMAARGFEGTVRKT